jgi:hypothetical protein
MASGTITGTTSNQFIASKIEWSSTADSANNKSTVTATLYYRRTNSGHLTYGTGTFSLNIGGSEYSSTLYVTIGESWTEVISHSVTIPHDDDGTKRITISATGGIPGTTLTSTSFVGNTYALLDRIARESVFSGSLPSPKYFSDIISVRYKAKSAIAYTQITVDVYIDGAYTSVKSLNCGRTSIEVQDRYITLGESVLSSIYTKLTNTTEAKIRIGLLTYSDSAYTQKVGSGQYTECTCKIPENASTKPTVSMSLSNISTLPSPYNSLYLQGQSKVKASLTSTAKYGATIVSSTITVNGVNYESPYESAPLSQAGTISVKATVKDSRGFYGTYYKDIEVIPYSKPYVSAKSGESSIVVARCNQSADFTDEGTYLKIKAKAVFSKVISNGVQNNYGNLKYRYRKEGGTYNGWVTILNGESQQSDEVITAPLLGGALDTKSNYQVQIVAFDDLYESAPITIAIPSVAVYMDRPKGGKSMGLGGYSQGDGNLDVHWKTKARGGLSVFDSTGEETPIVACAQLNPHEQVETGWNPDSLENGIYAVAKEKPLKQGDTVIMYNGVLIQMTAYDGGNVKLQLALTSDETRNPYYRVYWYGTWGNWRGFKL